jgi:hypothetical protein
VPFNPSDGTQSEQQCGLKAVASPDGIDDGHGGRLDLNYARLFMPRLSSPDSARNDNQVCTRLDE